MDPSKSPKSATPSSSLSSANSAATGPGWTSLVGEAAPVGDAAAGNGSARRRGAGTGTLPMRKPCTPPASAQLHAAAEVWRWLGKASMVTSCGPSQTTQACTTRCATCSGRLWPARRCDAAMEASPAQETLARTRKDDGNPRCQSKRPSPVGGGVIWCTTVPGRSAR